jgi:hypothetical protein
LVHWRRIFRAFRNLNGVRKKLSSDILKSKADGEISFGGIK